MKKTRSAHHEVLMEEITVTSFGYELIRGELLTNILGKDAPEILYWSGKNLARSYPLKNLDEICAFFEKAGWGQLAIKKETKNELYFGLSSPLIENRLQMKKDTHYKLEAGFLAQQIESQIGLIAEATEQALRKERMIEFTVRWDKKDLIEK